MNDNNIRTRGSKVTRRADDVIDLTDDAILLANWHTMSNDGVMRLQPLHYSSYVHLNSIPTSQKIPSCCPRIPSKMNQIELNTAPVGLEKDSSLLYQSEGERQRSHKPNILKHTSKKSKVATLEPGRCRLPADDRSEVSHTGQLKNCNKKRKLKNFVHNICDQLKVSMAVKTTTMLNSLAENCHVIDSSWKSFKSSKELKESKPRRHIPMKSSRETSTLAPAHTVPLCSVSSDRNSPSQGHTCRCCLATYGEPSPASSKQAMVSITTKPPSRVKTSVVSTDTRMNPRVKEGRRKEHHITKPCSEDGIILNPQSESFNRNKQSDEGVTRGTFRCSVDVSKSNIKNMNLRKEGFRTVKVENTSVLKSSDIPDRKKDETDQKDVAICPKVGSSQFDPMPYTVGNTDRSPFGFYHNDKLYVFVPPSPDKNDPCSDSQTEETNGSRLTGKSGGSPLNLQSNQLMGTSQTLVNRIREKSEKIPVVIVRPKKKKQERLHETKGSFKAGPPSTEHEQTGTKCGTLPALNNKSRAIKTATEKKLAKSRADGKRCDDIAKSHTTGVYSTSSTLERSDSNVTGLNTAQKEDGETAARQVSRGTDMSNIHLKDCYIDMGTRKALPASVTLGLRPKNVCSVSDSNDTKFSLTPSNQTPSAYLCKKVMHVRKEKVPPIVETFTSLLKTAQNIVSERKKNQSLEPEIPSGLRQVNSTRDSTSKTDSPMNTTSHQGKCLKQRLNSTVTSLLSEFLLNENKQSSVVKKEPITVVLQTQESKTILMIPTSSIKTLNLPIQLVTKESSVSTSAKVDLNGSQVNSAASPETHVTTTKTKDLSVPNRDRADRHADFGNKKESEKAQRNMSTSCRQLSKSTIKTCLQKSGKRERKKSQPKAQTHKSEMSGRKTPASVRRAKRSPVKNKQQYSSSPRSAQQTNSSNNLSMQSSKELVSPVLETLDLQRRNTSIEREFLEHRKNDPADLFRGINQLFYAAGAQISTSGGLTVSRRAVFTICFTSQDPFLKSQQGVPANLPAFLSFSKDHMVSMIFTSHLCSGFFLVQPTGIVKQDPHKPDIYVESAYLMPYSHRLQFPSEALSLVVGPLEEDWRLSLTLANSLRQRASPDDVVGHFIGLEECRCFSTSLEHHTRQSDDRCERRALSSSDYERHKHNLEIMSCTCKDCGSLVRSRRGKRKLSDVPSMNSEDEDHMQDTSLDGTDPTQTNLCDSECGTALNSSLYVLGTSADTLPRHSDLNSGAVKNRAYLDTSPESKSEPLHENFLYSTGESRRNMDIILESQIDYSSKVVSIRHEIKPVGHNRQDDDDGQRKELTINTVNTLTETSPDLNSVVCHHDNGEEHGLDAAGSSDLRVTSNKKRKCDKMVVKMGFPWKKGPRRSSLE